jgi:opacity protein-like surface antigen
MLWKLTAVLAFSLACLPATAARAADGDTPECCNYNGPYIGAGGGFAIEDFDKGNADNGAAVNLRVGYRFLDFLAVEGMGEYEPHFNGKSGIYNSADVSTWAGYLNGKVYPVARWTGWFQPYLLAGAGYMWGDVKGGAAPFGHQNENGFVGRFGTGIDFFLTEHFFVTVDGAYLLPTGDASELDQTIVGGALQYRF